MVFTFLVFLHLIATCAAIGTIVVTDLRLVARLMDYRVVIPGPERLETLVVMVSLLVLYLTGAAMLAIGVAERPDYLANGKLQGKLALVGVLTLNAFILHFRTFPILALARTVSSWRPGQWLTVAASVSLSNSLWFFSAFLGVARPWNFQVSAWFVLGLAVTVWACVFLLTNLGLFLASRDGPRQQPDWVDSTIAAWGGIVRRSAAPADPAHRKSFASGLIQQRSRHRVVDRRIASTVDRRSRSR